MMRQRLYESEQKYFGVVYGDHGVEPVCFMGDTAWDLVEMLREELYGPHYDHDWLNIMKRLRKNGKYSDYEYSADFDESEFIFGPVALNKVDYDMVRTVMDLVHRGNRRFSG